MSEKYKKKELTGREYVDKTTEFADYTYLRCDRLPKRWKETLLLPMLRTVDEIEKLVQTANKVYINEKNMAKDQLIIAYNQRIGMLKQSIGLFADFDAKFNRLMGHVDIARAEKQRLKNIFCNIIKEEQAANPDVEKIEIKVISHADQMEYRSLNGDQCMRLKLTSKNRDHWIDLETAAAEYIRKRITGDNKAISRLKNQA